MNKMIETIKELKPNAICMFKMGNFYHAYNRDSYVLSYLFKYKIKELGRDRKSVV